jgi:hypothetical protein
MSEGAVWQDRVGGVAGKGITGFNCYLVVFDSTHQALRGEEVLKREGIPHEVVNTPPQFKADCGISLRVAPSRLEGAEGALRAAGVVYSRIEPYFCRWLPSEGGRM